MAACRPGVLAVVVVSGLLAACAAGPSGSPTGSPSSAPGTRIAVTDARTGVPSWVPIRVLVDDRAVLGGLLPHGGAAAGTAYVVVGGDTIQVLAPDGSVTALLGGQSPATLAVRRPVPSRLAWGQVATGGGAILVSAPVSGAPVTTLDVPGAPQETVDTQLLAVRWSSDGSGLYFAREEMGLGGYGLFEGVSSLYRYDVRSATTAAIVPFAPSPSPTGGCLDDLSADESHLVDHCGSGRITVRDLGTKATRTLRPPQAFVGHRLGGARFSPSGSLVAFGIGRGTGDATEQCWLAVGPSGGGDAEVVWTGERGDSLDVVGWLDEQTLLLQVGSVGSSDTTLRTYRLGDRAATFVATGMFAALG